VQTRTITNLVLGIALAALAIFIYTEIERDANPQLTALTPLQVQDVTHLSINNVRNQDIVLQKLDGHWQMLKPFPALANESRIEKLLGIVKAHSQAQYSVDEVDLSQLRLINPDIRLHINEIELLVGTTEPLEQRRYIKLGDQVHLITDSYSYLAQGAATDFIDTKLLPGDPQLESISLPDFSLHSTDNGWQVQGLDQQPSADSIQTLLDEWRQARALKISREDSVGLNPDIRISFANNVPAVAFNLTTAAGETILTRPDTGLAYHLHDSSAKRLLTFTEPTANTQNEPDSPAPTTPKP